MADKQKVASKLNIGKQVNSSGPKLDTTLVKGLLVLELIAESRSPVGIKAISEELGLGKSNVHRLVTTLVEMEFVKREIETRLCLPTLKLWELGSMAAERTLLKRVSQAIVPDLGKEVRETAYLSVLVGSEILYLDMVIGPNGGSSMPRPGQRVPAIFPASGQLLLAYQRGSQALIDHIYASEPQAGEIDRKQFDSRMETIRDRGYAVTDGGYTRDVTSIAVPIIAGDNIPVAALGIGVLSSQYDTSQLEGFLATLRRYAIRAEQTLGPGAYVHGSL